jgi:hypothetical protein
MTENPFYPVNGQVEKKPQPIINSQRAYLTAKSFGEGSDARIKGLSSKHNPYSSGDKNPDVHTCWLNWQSGWWHCNKFWGSSVEGRWTYQPLREIDFSILPSK